MTRLQTALAAVVVLLLGVLIGAVGTRAIDAKQGPSAVDVGFAQDMAVHHLQAVQMSGLILDTTDLPVRALAYDILTTQQFEVGQMQTWLHTWGKPLQADGATMTWMSSGSHDMSGMHHGMSAMGGVSNGLMPGMATPAQLQDLKTAVGPARDIMFLQLMIRHHIGGAPMATEAAAHAALPEVRNLADKMVAAQGNEVELMKKMLNERGAAA